MKAFSTKSEPIFYPDERGGFATLYNADLNECNDFSIKQVSTSVSRANVFRGLHFQYDKPMAKGMRVVTEGAFMYEMDVRPNSTTFGEWYEFWAPAGMTIYYAPAYIARGFRTVRDDTVIEYFHNEVFSSDHAMTIWYGEMIEARDTVASCIMNTRDRILALTLSEWRIYAASKKVFLDAPND